MAKSFQRCYLIVVALLAFTGCVSTGAPQPTDRVDTSAEVQAENSLQSFRFSAHLTNRLVLSGHLPDDAAQNSLMNLAAAIFPTTEIVNEMNTDGLSVSGWHRTTRWGLSSLSKLKEGRLVIVDHSLHLEGHAANAGIKTRVEAATIGLKAEIQATVQLTVE